MSKLSFRARALDPSKQMPIYLAEELPDLPEYSAINRAVPQMPSGMEKEEESEHHLQRAICTGLIIPTPEVFTTDQDFYDQGYPPNYKMPRQMIHMQPLGLEQDVPDYDMDSADEAWVNQQSRRLDMTPLKFEQMMDRLEKSSGQTVVTLNEAKALLKQDDEVSIAVYDYWLNKRLKMQHPLILSVKTENRPGASSNNPYLAFRRRTEKMQTRKNRKNDETSYEKMLKLRRDLQRATTMLEMVKRREKTKREQLHLSIEIFEKRVQLRDFSGAILSELSASFKSSRPAFAPLYTNQYSHHTSSSGSTPTGGVPGCAAAAGIGGALAPGLLAAGVNSSGTTATGGHLYSSASQYLNSSSLAIDAVNAGVSGSRKEKRQYKKRKHKLPRDKQQQQQQHLQQQQQYLAGVGVVPASATTATAAVASSLSAHHHAPLLLHLHRQSSSPAANESNIETEEEEFASGSGQHAQKVGSESEDEATFAFRRKQSCSYLKPLEHDGNWPWEPKEDNGFGDPKYRFTLTSIRHPRPRCIGFARRRLGRGGRVILDRVATDLDDFWSQLDYTIFESGPNAQKHSNKETNAKPASPPTVVDLPTNTAAVAIAAAPTPANKIKTEPIEEKEASKLLVSDDDGVEADFDDDYAEHEACVARADSNISRDAIYSSALTLMRRQRYRMRKRLQRLKEKLHQQDDTQATKRPRFNDAMPPGQAAKEQPLPRKLLHQLALSLERNSSLGGGLCDILSFGEMVKREQLKSDALAEEVVVVDLVQQEQYQQQQTNPRFNNNMLNNNNNSCSNINKNVSVSDKDKFNVIKLKMEADAEEEDLSLADTVATAAATATTTTTIKQELNDAVSVASADDSNEPLSSIQKHSVAAAATAAMDIMVDEDNVNLAQLSSLMRHTVKKEPVDVKTQDVHCNLSPLKEQQLCSSVDDDEHTSTLNQVEDVVRLRNIRNARHAKQQIAGSISVLIEDEEQQAAEDYISSLSPSSSQRLDVCNELLSEIRRDWLHFRPKTPTDELSESDDCKLPSLLDDVPRTSMVDWTQETPIAVEMLAVPVDESRQHKHASLWDVNADEGLFVSSSFKYAELEPDTQLLQAAYTPEGVRSSSKSPESGAAGNSNSGLDFNLSGDSLTDINLLGDGDETDENMLENILQECQIDDIKTLNQATTFWNGILDGEVSATDVETAAGLLDCMDSSEKKPRDACGAGGNRGSAMRAKCGRLRNGGSAVFGSSNFSSTAPTVLRDDTFFKADQTKDKVSAAVDMVKVESPVPLLTHLPQTPTAASALLVSSQSTPALVATTVSQSGTAITPQALQFVSGASPQQVLLQTPQQPAQLQQQQLPKVPGTLNDIIGVSAAAAPTQLQIQSQQQQQQQQIVQLQPPQVRSVAVQQFHQLQPQHQFLQQMHRDLVSSSPAIMAHYVPTSSSAPVVASASATTLRQQPTLTPIGSTASGNHMIYTTSGDGTAGPQKIYIQKAPGTVVATHASSAQLTTAATQVPNSPLSTNAAVITLSNVKLESDGSQTATLVGQQSAGGANILTLDGSGSVTVTSSVTSAPSVSIISTASGQQVAVHSIGGVQNVGTTAGGNGGVHMSTAPTPLIVTTAARNSQQLTQQQLVHGQAAQQIVWRQIGSTNATGVLTTTTEAAAAMAAGNKIVWASRPGQKRQLNGPEGATDINKLLLNRKFSRRIISQHNTQLQQQQHQIQITKQHLQQLQQHRLQQQQLQQQQQQQQQQQLDDDSNTHVVNSSGGTLESTSVSVATASPQQQPAQKVQMQSGKVIKMPPFPLLVSEVHMKAQQQLQHNSAAIAANHNYSLQPTAIITSQSPQQSTASNKIFLTSSSNNSAVGIGGNNAATNFTIATTAGELQAATTLSTQKIQYKDLQNSNLKVNFVSTGMVGGGGNSTGMNAASGVQPGSIMVDTKTVVMAQQQQQQHQQQTVVLNKGAATSMQQRQLLQQPKRILNIIGAASVDANASGVANAVSVSGATPDNSKRVLYTSLLNVKPLPKNNAGQMQMQLGQGSMAHAVLRGRIGNNQTIYATNMRTVPIAATTSVGGSMGHVQVATSSPMAVVAAAVAGTQAMATSASTATTTAGVTLEAVATLTNTMVTEGKSLENVTSNNNGGVAMLTAGGCNALSNNSSNGSSAGGGSNNAMATTTTTNNTGASATINR